MPVFVNDRDKSVFFAHVPKTAGTYIEDLFKHNGYACSFWEPRPHRIGMTCSPQHYHTQIFEPLFDLDAIDFKFMTVRNPVDRLLSEYRHQFEQTKVTTASLENWLIEIVEKTATNPSCDDNHLRAQADFFHPLFEIYKQEDGFDRAWAKKINRKFGLRFKSYTAPLRHNTKTHQPQPLTPVQKHLLVEYCETVYAADFEKFDYDPKESTAWRR